MAPIKRPSPYNFDPAFEKQVVALACSRPEFWQRIGSHLDPELFNNKFAKLSLTAARAIATDLGHGPGSSTLVIQRLRGWMAQGKYRLEDIKKVAELFDDAEDAGLLSDDEVIAEIAPMLQERMRMDAVKLAIATVPQKGDLSKVVALEAKALRIGQLPPTRSRLATTVRLSEVKATVPDWLWPGWLARGKMMLIDGDPNVGKSTLTMDLAARVSSGLPMPFSSRPTKPAPVLLLCGEDAPSDTLLPRIVAAGGNAKRVSVITGMPGALGDDPISFPEGLEAITALIEREEPSLLIIDPLMAYLGGSVDSHRDQDVRRVLMPLGAIAEKHGVAVVLVRHLNKAQHGKAIHRGGGSIGAIAAVRTAGLVARDPRDPERRILASTKNNIAATPRSLRFKLVPCGNVAKVEYVEECDADADSLLTAPTRESAVDKASKFLEERLPDGPVLAQTLESEALARGISKRSLERSKQALPIEAKKAGERWAWSWTESSTGEDRQDRQSNGIGGVGGVGDVGAS